MRSDLPRVQLTRGGFRPRLRLECEQLERYRGEPAEGALVAASTVGRLDPRHDWHAQFGCAARRRRSRTLQCRSAKNDFTAALSPAGTNGAIDPCKPLCDSARTNFIVRNWLPPSEGTIVARGERSTTT
jgi:hypothetical protein